jgi:hypothetical protein
MQVGIRSISDHVHWLFVQFWDLSHRFLFYLLSFLSLFKRIQFLIVLHSLNHRGCFGVQWDWDFSPRVGMSLFGSVITAANRFLTQGISLTFGRWARFYYLGDGQVLSCLIFNWLLAAKRLSSLGFIKIEQQILQRWLRLITLMHPFPDEFGLNHG